MIYKKLRNKKKKLDKIKETEIKVKKGGLVPNQEQLDKIRDELSAERIKVAKANSNVEFSTGI